MTPRFKKPRAKLLVGFKVGDVVRFVENGNTFIERAVIPEHGYIGIVLGPSTDPAAGYDKEGYSARSLATGCVFPLVWEDQMEEADAPS
jgi:hypothetical protein